MPKPIRHPSTKAMPRSRLVWRNTSIILHPVDYAALSNPRSEASRRATKSETSHSLSVTPAAMPAVPPAPGFGLLHGEEEPPATTAAREFAMFPVQELPDARCARLRLP